MGSSQNGSSTPVSLRLTPRTSSDSETPPSTSTKPAHLSIPINARTDSSGSTCSRTSERALLSSSRAPGTSRASTSPNSDEGVSGASEPDENEGSPMLARWDHPASEEEEDDAWSEPDVGPPTPGLPPSDWGRTPSASGGSSGSRRSRTVYGGGGMAGGGNLNAVQCAGVIWAATLGPTPLLLPSAVAALGVPLFFVLLGVVAALAWFAYIVLGVEARYVGAKSYPSLAAAVFPSLLSFHRLGAMGASLLMILFGLTKGLAMLLAVAEVGGQIAHDGQEGKIAWVAAVSLSWALLPLIIPPILRRIWPMNPNPNASTSKALARGPFILSCILWPLALVVLAIRLKHLPDMPPASPPPPPEDGNGNAWRAVALLVGSMGAHHDAFTFLTSLARPSSTATRGRGSPSASRISTGSAGTGASQEGRRNQWPLAAFLGVGAALVVQVGWALVGYLGVPADADEGGQIALGGLGNILNSPRLPTSDWWLQFVRLLVLGALLCGVEGAMSPVFGRFTKGLHGLGGHRTTASGHVRRRSSYARIGGSSRDEVDNIGWRDVVARVGAWAVIGAAALAIEAKGAGDIALLTTSQVAGVGAALMGFVGPAFFFIVLFHLRTPRSIFVSDASLPAFAGDALLLRKERAVQRRLSGRRIWMDIGVGLGLLPVGVVVLVRAGGAMLGWE